MEEKIQEKQELSIEKIEDQALLELPDRHLQNNIVTTIVAIIFNLGGGGGGGAGGSI